LSLLFCLKIIISCQYFLSNQTASKTPNFVVEKNLIHFLL
jgi:hypothetical protein